MKTPTILAISLMSCYSICQGQNYKSIFSQDTTRWNVFECAPDAGGTIAYYSFSDTVINSKTYHKIYREFITSPEQPIGQGSVCGYVHEDTINGKYWFLKFDNDESIECLFMDLSLNKEDTFILISDFRFMWEDTIIVDSVYMDNNKRVVEFNKTQTNCINSPKLRFVEGVGAINGFYMGEDYEQPYLYSLICKYNNDTLFYSTELNIYSNCFLEPGGGIEYNSLELNINIYPNPSNGLINVELAENHYEDSYLNVYNSDGTLILRKLINNSSFQFIINEPGLYLLEITDGIKKYSKKIIVTG